MSRTRATLLEYAQSGSTPLKVDREKGIIFEPKVLGERSANPPPHDNFYPPETRAKAIALIESARVNIDHPPRGQTVETRPYGDGLGILIGLHEKGDGLYAREFRFNPKHALAEQIFWDAENAPQHLGFSINGEGDKTRADGKTIVECIDRIYSVDLVSRPATTNGLFESRRFPVKKKVRDLIESLKAKRPGYSRALREMAEAGMTTQDTEMDDPGETPVSGGDAPDHEEALKQGFRGAIQAVLDDDGMDLKAKLKKIKEILTTEEKMLSKDDGADDDSDSDYGADDTTTESRKGKKGKGSLLERRLRNRDLWADADLKLTKLNRKALDGCRTDAEVSELIEEVRVSGTTPARGGAKSAAGGAGHNGEKLRESKQGAEQKGPLTFEGDKAAEQRLTFLRSER